MGQAKINKVVRKAEAEALVGIDMDRVARAVRNLCIAASTRLGTDCYVHAAMAAGILKRLGVESRICVGEAAWRVGPGEMDVVSHLFSGFHGVHVGYHAWLMVGGKIFDPTLYQLPTKAVALDAQDGGSTQLTWAPDFLLLDLSEVQAFEEATAKTASPGSSHYKRLPDVERHVCETYQEDPDDLDMAWMCYLNHEATVFGPNFT